MKIVKSPSAVVCIVLALAASQSHAQLTVGQKEDIGLTALQTQLGAAMPTGAGLSASQVEAEDASLNYRPNVASFTLKTFAFPSGGTTGISGHATTVGQYFYGSGAPAPDIGATASGDQISSWEANNWLTAGFLRTGSTALLPAVESNDLQSHSWVGAYDSDAVNVEALRRTDYSITRDDYVATFGLNNGTGTLPKLMAGAHNGITVGRSDGSHSAGTTAIDGVGRMKPDLVVPASATSYATPTVASTAGLLIETARADGLLANGARHEVVKALIMNGATKNESEFTWSHTDTSPLDAVYGAGELNVQRSYNNLAAGEYAASTVSTVGLQGWDLGVADSVEAMMYFFDLPEGNEGTLSATLAWDRMVTATDNQPGQSTSYTFSSSLANLDLNLYSASDFSLDSMLGQSISSVDNVELLYFDDLSAGRYAITLPSDTSGTDYGLAWNLELTTVPEAGSAWLLLSALLLRLRKRRKDGKIVVN